MSVGLGMTDLFLTCRVILSVTHSLGSRPATIFSAMAVPVVASGLSGLLCWALARSEFNPFGMPVFATAILYMCAGGVLYIAVLALLERRKILEDARTVIKLLRK